MKILFLFSLVLLFVLTPAYAQLLSDATGLTTRLDIETRGHTFEVKSTANFDIHDFDFDDSKKKLTLYINSSLENNLGEVIIPQNFLGGNFTFYLNDQEFFPKTNSNEHISFVTLNFTGSGSNKLEIFGTKYLAGLTEKDESEQKEVLTPLQTEPSLGGGCLIATASFDSELAPQVQQLRELRDNTLLQTNSGMTFMNLFNQFYYSFSPVIADLERENPVFKEVVKLSITPLISSLSILNYVDMDSEYKVLGFGSLLLLLNVGMYFVGPLILLNHFHKFRKRTC